MCKVSICIPAYNQPEYLLRNLDSICLQSFQDYEVIITDDSADDSLGKLIDNYDFGGRLTYYHNKMPLGPPKNWNYGISKARGKYIKPLHHDDWFSSPDALHKLVALLESGDHSFVFSGCANISDSGLLLFHHAISSDEAALVRHNPVFLFYNNRIGSPSVTLFRKGLIRFDENIKYLVDSEFYIRLLQQNPCFSYTTEPLINIGHHDEQVTHTVVDDRIIMFREYLYTYGILPHKPENFRWYFRTFWRLVRTFDIRHLEEISGLLTGSPVPPYLPAIIRLNLFLHNTGMFFLEGMLRKFFYQCYRRFDHS